jgi:hypothetical protein
MCYQYIAHVVSVPPHIASIHVTWPVPRYGASIHAARMVSMGMCSHMPCIISMSHDILHHILHQSMLTTLSVCTMICRTNPRGLHCQPSQFILPIVAMRDIIVRVVIIYAHMGHYFVSHRIIKTST